MVDSAQDANEYPNEDRIMLFRQLRAEFLDFQELLEGVIKGELSLKDYRDYIERTKSDIDLIMGKIGEGDSSKADIVRSIKNMWEQVQANPLMIKPNKEPEAEPNAPSAPESTPKQPTVTETGTQEILHQISTLKDRIRKIVFLISLLTIPERLNRWLEKSWPGYYIPFHLVFEDEIPTAEDRVRLLKYLAYSPARIKNGIVLPGSGLIYRCENEWKRQIPYALGLLAIFLSITGIILASSKLASGYNLPMINVLIQLKDWPEAAALLVGWIAILLGVITHSAIGAAKSEKKEGMPTLISVKGIFPYLSAKAGELVWKQFMALIGLFGLMFSGIWNANTQGTEVLAANALLVGYSLDSVIELFGTSMEQRAATQVSNLKKQLEVTEEK
jgi:hypothetical protein